MSLGTLARGILGDRLFPAVGRRYRALFVDLAKVADSFPRVSGPTSVLDIGGGDGELLNLLLAREPELSVTMIDLNATLGAALRPEFKARVQVLKQTSIRDYAALQRPVPQLVLISDVIHHIPTAEREGFFEELRDLLAGCPSTIVIKDVEPGTFRARLGWLADRYVSGDRNVELISEQALRALLGRVFPRAHCEATNLIARDTPNYCLHVSVPALAPGVSR